MKTIHRWDPPARDSTIQRIATLVSVVVPFVGVIAAMVLTWGWGFAWQELILLVVMYLLTGFGVTVGFHRLFVHRSFNTVRPVKFMLGVLGSMSIQGPLLKWAAIHRRHHQHSDQEEDPHSPNCWGGGLRGIVVGLWHSHVGWMFKPNPPDLGRYVGDLQADPVAWTVHRYFGYWVILGLLVPTAIGAWLSGSWTGAGLGFIWGGLVRLFLVHHVTFSVNSVCHLWGRQPFDGKDHSRNNFLFGLLGLGEGWHNNHHAFPTSARHGLRWWEIDLSYLFIRALQLLGLAWDVRCPDHDAIANKLRRPA